MPPPDMAAEEAKCEDLEEVVIGDDTERFFRVGAQLPLQEKKELIKFLKRNVDVFAWNAYDALEIHLSLTQCQPIHHSQKAATPSPVKRARRCD